MGDRSRIEEVLHFREGGRTSSPARRDQTGEGWRPAVIAAVRCSQRQNEIVHIQARRDEVEAILDALRAVEWLDVEDDVRNGPTHEAWGTDEDGTPWRVHVDLPERD